MDIFDISHMFGRVIEIVFIDLEERTMRVLCRTEDMYNAECKVVNVVPDGVPLGKKFRMRIGMELQECCIVKFQRPDIGVLGILDYLLNPVNELWIVSGWVKVDPEREIGEFVPGIPGRLFWHVLNARDLMARFSHYIKEDDLKKLLQDASMGANFWRRQFMKCCEELDRMREFAERVRDETLKFMVEQARKNIQMRRELEEALGIELDPYLYIVWRRNMSTQERGESRGEMP